MKEISFPFIEWKDRALIIGLTGGIASGKSTAADFFQKAGLKVVNADMAAKEVFEKKEIQEKLLNHFGNDILENNTVSRKKVADRVFSDAKDLEYLNSIIHPEVRKKFQKIKESLAFNDILVYDVPLLFETNQDQEYDIIVTITASSKIRLERAMKRNGWSEDEFYRRDRSQIPMHEKEKRSDVVISNDGTVYELEEKLNKFIEHIKNCRTK